MTRETILAMTGRELDAAVEINLFRERYLSNGGHDTPAYSTDANACRLMEAEVERRKWEMGYVMELAGLMWPGSDCSKPVNPFMLSRMGTFDMMRSPLEMRCQAALITALNAKEGG